MKKLHYSEDSDYGDYDEVSVATTARTEARKEFIVANENCLDADP